MFAVLECFPRFAIWSHTVTQSHTVTHSHTQSHTVTHSHTQTHTVTHSHTQSHTDTTIPRRYLIVLGT